MPPGAGPAARVWRLLPLLAALGALTRTAGARETAIVPAADGRLGGWLVAGPVPVATARKLDLGKLALGQGKKPVEEPWAPRWRSVASGSDALDVATTVGVGAEAGPVALLGGVLSLSQELDGWLLISVDGAVDVNVGGRALLERDSPRVRAGSWDVIPVALPPGSHRIVLRLGQRGRHWGFELRVLERASLLPPAGAALMLPGTDERDAARLARVLSQVGLEPGLDANGYRPRLRVLHPRGVPRGIDLGVRVEAQRPGDAAKLFDVAAGPVPVTDRGVHALEVLLPSIPAERLGASSRPGVVRVVVDVGATRTDASLTLAPGAPQAVARARDVLGSLARREEQTGQDPTAGASTVERRLADLESAGAGGAGDVPGVARLVDALERLVDDIVDGRDPVHAPGVASLALRSSVDGSLQPVTVHVPSRVSKERRHALVLLLHGYGGTPDSVMKAFLDTDGASPVLDGFVVAPNAHGNAFYRGPGERSVLEVLDWALATYPIDRRRVSITGVSMGGTGTAHIALRHAERFAAASPLCGYHSFFVRRDTAGRPIRPWETVAMHHFSPASWAENGVNLPLYVAHGTKDLPLENSRVLVDRYRELRYSIVDDWPDVGHAVWERTWSGARMWRWLSKHTRDPAPLRVTVKTDSLRYGDRDWVHVSRIERPHLARVDARLAGNDRLLVATEHVSALSLDRPVPRVSATAAVSLEIDGVQFGFGPSESLDLVKEGGRWRKGAYATPSGYKRAGVEGPLHDAHLSDLVIAYGTLEPSQTRANRELAEALSRYRPDADVRYRVIADLEVDQRVEHEASLLLVGSEESNAVLRDLGAQLPLRARGGKLFLGDRALEAPGIGAYFIHPNPRSPGRYVVVLTAPTAAGIWRAGSLPQLLPDFVVYDDALADSAGEVVTSRGSVIAAGHFRDDWTLPEVARDPHAPAPAPPPSVASP